MDTVKKVNEVIMNLSILDKQPECDEKLKEDLGFDSLKIVELIVALEESLCIEIDESDLDPNSIIKVADLYKLAAKYAA
jgi:acyl carrier protein